MGVRTEDRLWELITEVCSNAKGDVVLVVDGVAASESTNSGVSLLTKLQELTSKCRHVRVLALATPTAAHALTGVEIKYDRTHVFKALNQSCRRMADAYSELLRSYGWWVEFWVDTVLAREIVRADKAWTQMVRASDADLPTGAEDDLGSLPSRDLQRPAPSRTSTPPCHVQTAAVPDVRAFFVIPTIDFNRFVRTNINKYVYVMDAIYIYYARDDGHIPEGAATLYILMLVYLQHFISHMTLDRAYILNNSTEAVAKRRGSP